MLEIKNLKKYFGDIKVLDGFSLSVQKGEKIAIIGESGCGKSTLLRLILGLKQGDFGNILFKRKNISRMSKQELQMMRQKIGMLFQSGALFDSMTVAENIAFSLIENHDKDFDEISDKVSELLDLVGMGGYENTMPSSLSGGQRKRIGLARAIVTNPELVLYDEPTTGLDPVLSTSIENLIVKLNEQLKMTSIIVSHQKSTILRTVDKIYMLHGGCLLKPETPKSIEKSNNPIIKHFIRGGL